MMHPYATFALLSVAYAGLLFVLASFVLASVKVTIEGHFIRIGRADYLTVAILSGAAIAALAAFEIQQAMLEYINTPRFQEGCHGFAARLVTTECAARDSFHSTVQFQLRYLLGGGALMMLAAARVSNR